MSDRLAVDGGTPVHTGGWPAWPVVDEESWRERVEPRLKAIYLGRAEGLPNTRAQEFEATFGEYLGVEHAMLTAHGTDALMVLVAAALNLDGLGRGGEVLCPQYTFIASASAALAVQCGVCFVDIDRRSFDLSPEAVEAAIGPNTAAIMAVHLGGQACDMDALQKIADKHGLALLEDCAQAHGALHHETQVGAVGLGGGFSFQSSKNLTSGEGGLITTNDHDVYLRSYALRNIGRFPGGERWEHPLLGWNYRGSEYLAALLSARFETFCDEAATRDANGIYLNSLLANIPGITPPERMPWCGRHAYHLYMGHYDPAAFGGHTRNEFLAALRAEGIPAGSGYGMLLSDQEALKLLRERYPDRIRVTESSETEWVIEHTFWLTQNILLADRESLAHIAEAITKVQRAWGG